MRQGCIFQDTVFFICKLMGIKLSKRKLKKGRFSLYLDCNLEGKRFKESLGITLEPPTCKEARQANCVKWQLAKLLRARREIDYLHTHYWSKLPPLFQVSNAQRHSDEGTETLRGSAGHLSVVAVIVTVDSRYHCRRLLWWIAGGLGVLLVGRASVVWRPHAGCPCMARAPRP